MMREDWVEVEIGSVANLYQPKTISAKMLVADGDYPVYGANGIIGNYDKFNHEEEEFLITCRGATCGNVHITKPFSWINGNAMVVKPFKQKLLSLEYLKFVFSNKGRTQKAISGSAQPQITRTTLSPIKIPLAPLPEQRAIVAKIEELFSDLDKGIADLKKAQAQLKVYRQAVLKKAFEGELTNTIFNRVDITELGDILTGNTPPKKDQKNYSSSDYNFYKPTDLNAGGNVSCSNDFLSKIGFENSRQVPPLSILVTCIGATIGKTGLIKKAGGFNQQINAIVPFKDFDSKFIYYQALCIDFQMQIKINASSTTLPILNKSKFSRLKMNICSIEEQHQIVREIESRLSVCDKVEQTITESLEKAKALRQSILKKAFAGSLLSAAEIEQCKQAPDYEPASVLLEKIKAAKEKK